MKIAGKREKILMQWEGTWKKTVEILSSRLLTLSAEPTNLSNGSLRKRKKNIQRNLWKKTI